MQRHPPNKRDTITQTKCDSGATFKKNSTRDPKMVKSATA
jgi:hypothetical protein